MPRSREGQSVCPTCGSPVREVIAANGTATYEPAEHHEWMHDVHTALQRYLEALLEIEAIHNSPASDAPVLIEQADKARQIANRAVTGR